jgi:hypothetical protein
MKLIKIKNKRHFVCALSVFLCLTGIGPLLQVYAGEDMDQVVYWFAGNPDVYVRANIKSIKLVSQKERELEYRMQAHISVTNVSADPVFIYRGLASDKYPYPRQGPVDLARTKAQALSGRYFVSNYEGSPALDNSLYWQSLRIKVNQKTPPADLFLRIEPKEIWEFDKEIAFGIDNYSGKNELDEVRRDPHVWLQVEFVMWPMNLDSYAPCASRQELQERWRPGHLIIANLVTEPVELTLPLK